jgi:protein-S-isoprenylcysteine O-methyltransferase Ste14
MERRTDTGIRIVPPVVFTIALAVAFIASWLMPVHFVPKFIQYSLGPVLLLASLSVMPSIIGAYRRANTPFDVRRVPDTLIVEGCYRYSRNPTYVALVVVCMGISVISDNPWIFATLSFAIVYMSKVIIPNEEVHLEAQFGDEYMHYKSRVRRWI